MNSCDILIVGGGPAGSSCAWGLRNSGLDVVIMDRQSFPRDKVCGGWITPPVLDTLEIDPCTYSQGHVLQWITGFRTGMIGSRSHLDTDYGRVVSYGIRRRELDAYLLHRCLARVYQGTCLSSLQRTGDTWVANDNLHARMVVGAGGHFCPVARQFGSRGAMAPVVAQETEFEMDSGDQDGCNIAGTTPQLYFCPDLKGYGWCFRKGTVLNIGLGRADQHGLPGHVSQFLRFLKTAAGLSVKVPALQGHAYRLYGTSPSSLARDGLLLVGDAAGLAYPHSGEGILPAIESGLLAAQTILAANGDYRHTQLDSYPEAITQRFDRPSHDWGTRIGRHVPSWLIRVAAAQLMNTRWLVRNLVLDNWFLHC